ncbi:hypothetical protein ACLB2K_051274 [Fragaria x ananassa]
MAGGGMVSSSGGKQYPGRTTLRVFITCIVAAFGGLIFGYDLGISGGVTSMDVFLKKFFPEVYVKETGSVSTNQYCTFNSLVLTLFTSSLYLAALVSCLLASTITRACGRRPTMLGSGVLFLVGALLNAFAQNIGMLIAGRLFHGFGIGFANQAVPIYLSETAPYNWRGALNMMFQMAITLGILFAGAANYLFDMFFKNNGNLAWRLSLGGAAVPALFIIIGSFFLPDTPNSLIERGKLEEAKAQLVKLRGVDNVDEEFNDLKEASEASKLIKHPWKMLFTRKYRPQIVFAIAIPAFQQFTGMNVITFYAPVLFKTVDEDDEDYDDNDDSSVEEIYEDGSGHNNHSLERTYNSPQSQSWHDTVVEDQFINQTEASTVISAQTTVPWMAIGDFNSVLGAHEKSGGPPPSRISCLEFQNMSDACDFVHLDTAGARFSWTNGCRTRVHVELRLDKSLCNTSWFEAWPYSSCIALPRVVSDHTPLIFSASKLSPSGPKPFRFQSMWLNHLTFRDTVATCWSSSKFWGCPMFVTVQKLKALKSCLRN